MFSDESGFWALERSSRVTDVKSCVFFALRECRILYNLFFIFVFEKNSILALLNSIRNLLTSCMEVCKLTKFL